jgi:hypothetical protein
MAFLVICVGITILQMSKIDPAQLSKLDRRSTILLQAARQNTESLEEKSVIGAEDPGMDAIRGSFGPVGSIIRARSARRLSQSSAGPNSRLRSTGLPYDGRSWISDNASSPSTQAPELYPGMKRHQLWDAPVPQIPSSPSSKVTSLSPSSAANSGNESGRRPTIKFDNQALVHSYHPPGSGDDSATHEHRNVVRGQGGSEMPYLSLPIIEGGGSEDSAVSGSTMLMQTVLAPLRSADEKLVQSAPPTMSPRYALGARPDARELFNKSSQSSLLSFSPGPVEERGRNAKRYPKGAGDDDREESVSLWQRQSLDDDRFTPTDEGGGIRLVPTGSRYVLCDTLCQLT